MQVEEELETYLQVLWRYKRMIAACAVFASIIALGISFLLTPLFSATATMRVASAPGGNADYSYYASATRLSNTYVEIATSDISLDEVVKRLSLQKRPIVEVEVVPETELITISASDPDPAIARDIANTLATLMVEESLQLYGGNAPTAREILEKQLQQAKVDLDTAVSEYASILRAAQSTGTPASGTPIPNPDVEMISKLVSVRQQIYGDLLQRYETARTNEQLRTNFITIVQPAYLPLKPASPIIPLNAALGLVAGLVMGVILAFMFEGMDDTLRGIEDVQSMTSLPILCRVPEMESLKKISMSDIPSTPAIEQLSARLILFDAEPKPTVFLLTSPEPGAGKSTIASNLAVSLAQGGNKVLLVDMDFHRPRQHTIMSLGNRKGLSNYLLGQIELDAAIQTTKLPNLRVITVGPSQIVTFDWLTPAIIGRLLEKLRHECDFVLIDAPALLSVADPIVLASQVDSVILLVARRITGRKNLRYALQQLTEIKVKVAGIVVNKLPNSPLYSYYSHNNTPNKLKPKWKKLFQRAIDARSKRTGLNE